MTILLMLILPSPMMMTWFKRRRQLLEALANLFVDENGDHLVDENGDRLGGT
jgi:hypothetical protein